jgi:hypothetical protein
VLLPLQLPEIEQLPKYEGPVVVPLEGASGGVQPVPPRRTVQVTGVGDDIPRGR